MTKLHYTIFGGIVILAIAGVFIYFRIIPRMEMEKLSKEFPDWVVVQGDLAPFQALFPREPQIGESNIPFPDSDIILKQKLYVAEVPMGMTYVLSAVVYPSPVGGELEENLRGSLGGMLTTLPGAELTSSRMVTPPSGEKSLEFLIYRKEVKSHMKGRLTLKDAVLYQYWVAYEEGRYLENAYAYFVSSFRPSGK